MPSDMTPFIRTILQFAKISEESQKQLSYIAIRHEFPKGHILVKQHTVCSNFYFIEKGLTRTFYVKDGKDVTDWISTENTFAVSIISFINRIPDRRTIELLEPSVLYAIDYNELENLCSRYHDIEHAIRKLLSFGFVELQNKFDELHFSTARQRYQNLLKNNPTIIQRVPLGMIASLLGITQETLSRIRGQK